MLIKKTRVLYFVALLNPLNQEAKLWSHLNQFALWAQHATLLSKFYTKQFFFLIASSLIKQYPSQNNIPKQLCPAIQRKLFSGSIFIATTFHTFSYYFLFSYTIFRANFLLKLTLKTHLSKWWKKTDYILINTKENNH